MKILPFPKGRKPKSQRHLELRGEVVIHFQARRLARLIVKGPPRRPPDRAA